MTRSRLRRPTSKSTTTVRSFLSARAAPSAAVDVVLPTPPLPDVTTITLPIWSSPVCDCCISNKLLCPDLVAIEPELDGLPVQIGRHLFRSRVDAVDRQQLGFELAAEDTRRGIPQRARERPAAQRSI